MQITLKQSEIEAALKAFVQSQGISLFNKSIAISFTAGRKESGISAEIDIDDVGGDAMAPMPAFLYNAPVTKLEIPNLAQVASVEEYPDPEVPEQEQEPEAKTTSLFG